MVEARAQSRFLLALIVVFGLASAIVVWRYLGGVALGLIAAYLLYSPYSWLVERTKRPRLAASLIVALTLVLIVAPIVVVVAIFFEDIIALPNLLADLPLTDWVAALLGRAGLDTQNAQAVVDRVTEGAQDFVGNMLARSVVGVFHFFIGLFVFFFLLFYGLIEGRQMLEFVRRSVPVEDRRWNRLVDETARAVDGIFRGELLVALVQGVAAGIGWWLFGLPNPLIWAFVMTILAIVPLLGPALVMVPVGIWMLVEGDVTRGVIFLVYAVLLVGFIDNLVRPVFIGRAGKIHIAVVLVGIVGGLLVFGVVGLFLGPLVILLLGAAMRVWSDDNWERLNMPGIQEE